MNINDFEFKKSFGQNFIKEDSIVEKIKNVADIKDNSLIIEIGPGAGSLTDKLISTGNQVLAYEIDTRLKDILDDKFSKFNNFYIIFDDFLNRDIKEDIKRYKYEQIYVVANLPYYITTPIVNKIIDEIDVYKIVIMVQKEVGDRFSAKIGTKDYNSLTVFLNYYFDVKKEFIVSRNCFVPKPNVDSIVVSLTRKNNLVEVNDLDKFFKLVKDSFTYKRKNLRNNLKGYDLDKLSDVLNKYGHDLNIRAENISIEEFADISNSL